MRNLLTALLGAAVVFLLLACQPEFPIGNSPATPTIGVVVRASPPTPTPAATATPGPTPTPTQVPIATPRVGALSVGLVDTADIDLSRAPLAREGLQRAAREFNLESLAITSPPGELAANAMRLAESGYGLVIIVTPNTDLAALVAQRYPRTKFVTFGPAVQPQLPNLVSLLYAEDQAGFLAGALAGWLTKKDMVAFVGAEWSLEIVKFRKGYEHGVQYVNRQAVVLGNYVHTFSSPQKAWGEANAQLNEGADVLFAAGGASARGALEAAAERNIAAIAAESDPYQTLPKVAPVLVSTALVRYDIGVYDVVKATVQNVFKPGALTYDATNGAIGLAPFHDWESKVPDEAKKDLLSILEGLRTGTIKTDVRT